MRGGGWVAVQKKGGEAARPGAAACFAHIQVEEGGLFGARKPYQQKPHPIRFISPSVFSLLYINNNRDAISGNGVPVHMQLVSRWDARERCEGCSREVRALRWQPRRWALVPVSPMSGHGEGE